MQFDSQEQKDLVLMALNKLPVELGQAQKALEIAQQIVHGEVMPPERKDDLNIDNN